MAGSDVATKPAAEEEEARPPLSNEIAALLVFGVTVFLVASFGSFHLFGEGNNWGGPMGDAIARISLHALGFTAYLLPVFVGALGRSIFRTGTAVVSGPRVAGAAVFLVSLSIFLGLFGDVGDGITAGGWLGGFLATVARDTIGTLGATMAAGLLALLSVMMFTGGSLRLTIDRAGRAARSSLAEARQRRAEQARELARTEVVVARRRPQPRAEAADAPYLLDNVIEPLVKGRERRAAAPRNPVGGDYEIPGADLLDVPPEDSGHVDEEGLRKSADILEAKLKNFGIDGKVVAVRPGPVITTFEIEPAPGVKVNRIVNLQDDLTMALRALGVRILAPVPGKAVVGIEVANANREMVFLQHIIGSEEFAASKSPLTLALGKDSIGHPVAADLAKMPHLLLAGATGTGKSVSLNAMIMSILMKASPADVRFVMIDLKMLELSMYEDLPHLLVPVVTDPKKAVIVLKNLVEEMDNRYRTLKEKRVRNIDGYNQLLESGEIDEDVIELTEIVGEEGFEEAPKAPEKMPRIVIIIDELADLIMTSARQVEEPITRLAQKARACGIHLILATQRPSVDVITGLIKANFPTRVSFQVTSRVDSRTILDQIGAERLLGQGDMLFLPPGAARVRRLHGAYVSEDEIRRVTGFVKQQGRPDYKFELLEGPEEEEGGVGLDDEYEDEMYDMAVRVVTESRQASISWVQRKLRVGYNRAARMVERMEREGVVGPSDGGRPREVLAPPPPSLDD
jgi:S-DNA-T family DNA segregation ATPase FtsK/SpoIIIE